MLDDLVVGVRLWNGSDYLLLGEYVYYVDIFYNIGISIGVINFILMYLSLYL